MQSGGDVVNESKARKIVYERSGFVCERCDSRRATEWHHRKNRSQGGLWTPSNGLHLDSQCHMILTNTRREFYGAGWCVRRENNPAEVAVFYRGQWAFLDDEGGVTPVAEWEAVDA